MIPIRDKKELLSSFLNSHSGDTKPNCFNSAGIPYIAYDDSNSNYLDDTVVEVFIGLAQSNNLALAIKLADKILASGFPFTRSYLLPEDYLYGKGETPSVSLKFAYGLYELYDRGGGDRYALEADKITERHDKYIDSGIKDTYRGIPTVIKVYDNFGTLIPDFRWGSYTSDVELASWFTFDYSIRVEQGVDFLYDSMKQAESGIKKRGIFYPYYNRNLPENSSYGDYGEWGFGGILRTGNDYKHQYDTALNLARYYSQRWKMSGEYDIKAKYMLDMFLENIYLFKDKLPTDINDSSITLDKTGIYLDRKDIKLDLKTMVLITCKKIRLEFYIKVALIAGLIYEVNKDSAYLEIVNYYSDKIYQTLQNGGYYKDDTVTYMADQGLILQLFSVIESVNGKNYFTIINNALSLLNLPKIWEKNIENHPQRVVLDICQEGVDYILSQKFWEFALKNQKLTYKQGQYKYDLWPLGVDTHRIDKVQYIDGGWVELSPISYTEWTKLYAKGLETRRPQSYAIDNTSIVFDSIPDRDYGLYVSYYATEGAIKNYKNSPAVLPQRWYHVLKWFIAWKLGMYHNSSLTMFYESMFLSTLSQLSYTDSFDLSAPKVMPTRIRW